MQRATVRADARRIMAAGTAAERDSWGLAVSYPPGGRPDGDETQQSPEARPTRQMPIQPETEYQQPDPDPADRQPPPAAPPPLTAPPLQQPVYPPQGPTQTAYTPPPAAPAPYQQQPPQQTQQASYYPAAPQSPYAAPDPYAQQPQPAQPYPEYPQSQQPYGYQYQYQYDPNAYGYAQPPQGRPRNVRARNAWIAIAVAVGIVAAGVSAYWFGFHNQANSTPIAHGSTLTASATPTGTGSPAPTGSDTPNPLGTGGDEVSTLRALMGTMTDPGCREAFQTLITFDQHSAVDADDDTALVDDYDAAIAGLTTAQADAADAAASQAIGQVVTDWKAFTAALAAGQNPDDTTITNDAQQLTAACLAT